MISPNVVTDISKKEGIGWAIVEKDYFLTLLLEGVSHVPVLEENLVFKGGTALRKAYFFSYRYSEDLDFTLKQKLSGKEVRSALESAFMYLKQEHNADFRLRDFNSKPHFTDIKAQFIGLKGNKNSIAMDLTGDEAILDETKARVIANPYYEREFSMLVYSLEEILAEKLRSLLQRTRVRDYYDVWFLLGGENKFDAVKLREIFLQKVAYKKLSFTGAEQFLEQEKLAQAEAYYESQLTNQLKQLPPFSKIKRELEERVAKLKL